MKSCHICHHSDMFRSRSTGLCALTTQGSRAEPCGCECDYGDARQWLVRVRESGHYLVSESREGAEFHPDPERASVLLLDGARWFERRFPLAVDITKVAS